MTTTKTKAVLLVGGLGTRLRTVIPSAPKALAPVGNRPFLELLAQRLRHQGIRHLVMCTGYLADQIEGTFGDGRDLGVVIEYSREPNPLGTAGAIKHAEGLLNDCEEFLVMNGDSFVEIDYRKLIEFHRSHRVAATIAVVGVEDASRYGTVRTDLNDRVVEFCEKTGEHSPGLINAGVYVFSASVLKHLAEGPSSLEKDVFPKLLRLGVYASRQQGEFIDIGTPADYAKAQQMLAIRDIAR